MSFSKPSSTKFDEEEKLWSKPDSTERKNFESFGKLLLNTLSTHGSKVAQINYDTGVQLTYLQIKQSAIRIAQNLQNRGFGPRQPFTFMTRNSDYLISVALASMFLACPINPLHPILSKDEIIRTLKKVEPTVIFCDIDCYNQIDEALKELKFNVKIFTLGGQFGDSEPIENLLAETETERSFIPTDLNTDTDVAMMICSSGTTGPSKCILVSYHLLIDYLLYLNDIKTNDICLYFVPIYWTVWFRIVFRSISSGASCVITSNMFSPSIQLNIIKTHKVTILYIIPGKLAACVKYVQFENVNCSSVKQIYTYGHRMMESLVSQVNGHFPNAELLTTYGLSEIGKIATNTLDSHGNIRAGELSEGCTVKIVDDYGNRCGPNVSGVICVKTRPIFLGYLGDPEAAANNIDNEGFFLTEDIGQFNEDGILSVEDRKKNVISCSFYLEGTIKPAELENYLIQCPDIDEVCVIGIQILPGMDLPAAVIVRKLDSNLMERQVFQMIADKFADYAKLRGGVYFVDSLPKTISGKVFRKRIVNDTTEKFKARAADPIIQEFIADIPEEMRDLIFPTI